MRYRRFGGRRRTSAGGGRFTKGRLALALIMVAVSLFSYYRAREYNPVTDEMQHVQVTAEQEIALGLQAAPEMAAQHGGLHANVDLQQAVDAVGSRLVGQTAAGETPYQFDFHVLADEQTVNAFALPGGQVFITAALLTRLRSAGEVAGVLGHEIGHVVARHGAEHMAKAQLTQGLTWAAVLATYDPNDPTGGATAALAMLMGQLVNMKFGREDELESDRLGVRFMAESEYDPRALTGVMEVLQAAGGGQRQAEFFSTHPNPERRMERLAGAIAEILPDGVPAHFEP